MITYFRLRFLVSVSFRASASSISNNISRTAQSLIMSRGGATRARFAGERRRHRSSTTWGRTPWARLSDKWWRSTRAAPAAATRTCASSSPISRTCPRSPLPRLGCSTRRQAWIARSGRITVWRRSPRAPVASASFKSVRYFYSLRIFTLLLSQI